MFFETLTPDDPVYTRVQQALSKAAERTDYNQLVSAYNRLAVRAILIFAYEPSKLAVIAGHLVKRGLARDVDYSISGAETKNQGDAESVYKVYITRITAKDGELLIPKPRGKRKVKPALTDVPSVPATPPSDAPANTSPDAPAEAVAVEATPNEPDGPVTDPAQPVVKPRKR